MGWRRESAEVIAAREAVSYWATEKQRAKGSGDENRLAIAKAAHKKAKQELKETQDAGF